MKLRPLDEVIVEMLQKHSAPVVTDDGGGARRKLLAGYEILWLAVKNAAQAGNVTCKLAIENLNQLHNTR